MNCYFFCVLVLFVSFSFPLMLDFVIFCVLVLFICFSYPFVLNFFLKSDLCLDGRPAVNRQPGYRREELVELYTMNPERKLEFWKWFFHNDFCINIHEFSRFLSDFIHELRSFNFTIFRKFSSGCFVIEPSWLFIGCFIQNFRIFQDFS